MIEYAQRNYVYNAFEFSSVKGNGNLGVISFILNFGIQFEYAIGISGQGRKVLL